MSKKDMRKPIKVSSRTYEVLTTFKEFLEELFGCKISYDELIYGMFVLKVSMADIALIPSPGVLMNEKERHLLRMGQ